MTRRERLERKIEKREEWAEGRREKASGLEKQNEPFRGDWAFATQPGHIPERARANRRSEKAHEHSEMARHHEQKAAGLASQLDTSIFSDDTNAVEELERRIALREAERDAMKAANVAWRKAGKPGPDAGTGAVEEWQTKWEQVATACGWSRADLVRVLRNAGYQPYHKGQPFPGYALTNLGANIRRDKERVETIRKRERVSAEAEEAGGVLVQRYEDANWCRVTFSEKPSGAILCALRGAGYGWGGGGWSGYLDRLPGCVAALKG